MLQTELRIGNIVGATIAGQVHGELAEHIIKDGKDIDNANWYFPLPLTEKWLVKLGFDISEPTFNHSDGRDEKGYVINDELSGKLKDYFRVYWRNEKMIDWAESIWPHKSDDKGSNYFIYVCQGYVRSVRYVHELQNFYFMLTNQELTLK